MVYYRLLVLEVTGFGEQGQGEGKEGVCVGEFLFGLDVGRWEYGLGKGSLVVVEVDEMIGVKVVYYDVDCIEV